MSLDLPLIWAALLAFAVLLYVVLDGFDLGIGILFPFSRSPGERDVMMNTVAPVWDGNETWLVLGGGGLLAAFPAAYAVVMPAFYLPILLMLIALILRGVAFEFRFRARDRGRKLWTILFSAGSIGATFAQGLVLGGFIQGVQVTDGRFTGSAFDWLTPYTLLVACGLVAGYALLGAAWLVMKTEDALHGDARRWTWISGAIVGPFLAAVSVATLYLHPRVAERWGALADGFDWARFATLSPIPLVGLAGMIIIAVGLKVRSHRLPFAGAMLMFLSGYLGLAVGFLPYVAPYSMTFRDAAAPENALALMLVGAAVALPLTLAYTIWVYWLFRGKVNEETGYHAH